jgi:hypothetical protein
MKKIIVMGIMEFLELDDSTLGPIRGPEKREDVLVLLGAATSLIISGSLCYVLAVAINPYSYLLGLPLLTLSRYAPSSQDALVLSPSGQRGSILSVARWHSFSSGISTLGITTGHGTDIYHVHYVSSTYGIRA